MRCREVTGELSAYLDGELELGDRHEVEAHVAGCPECRRELQALRQMDAEFIEGLPPLEPSPALFPMLLERVSVKPRPWYLSFWKLGWVATGATACMLMLSFGMQQYQTYRDEQAALTAIDAYQPSRAVKNVFSVSRNEKARRPFDYRARLGAGSPFQLASYSRVADGIKVRGGER